MLQLFVCQTVPASQHFILIFIFLIFFYFFQLLVLTILDIKLYCYPRKCIVCIDISPFLPSHSHLQIRQFQALKEIINMLIFTYLFIYFLTHMVCLLSFLHHMLVRHLKMKHAKKLERSIKFSSFQNLL